MINLRDLVINAEATLGAPLFLVKEAATYAYENGVATSRRDGTRYTVAAPSVNMATIAIKVPGAQTVDKGDKAIVPVVFDGLELYIYFRDGKPCVGGRAKAIRKANIG